MNLKTIVLGFGILVGGIIPQMANASSTCSASNGNGDKTCSITCADGQAAVCQNGAESQTPDCYCSSSLLKTEAVNPKFTAKIVTASKCVVLTLGFQTIRFVNTCDKCQVAMFSDFNDGMKEFEIDPHGHRDIPVLSGQLVGEHDCNAAKK